MPSKNNDKLVCSFCGKSQDMVMRLISSPGADVFICDECIEACSEIIDNDYHEFEAAAGEGFDFAELPDDDFHPCFMHLCFWANKSPCSLFT